MSKYLADTTVAVEMLRGNKKAKEFLDGPTEISVVTFVELIQGCKDKEELKIVKKTCEILRKVEINTTISTTAVDLLSNHYLSHGLPACRNQTKARSATCHRPSANE